MPESQQQIAREAAKDIDIMFDGKLDATEDMAAIILRHMERATEALEQKLLSALAAIEKHNKYCAEHQLESAANVKIYDVDLSLLREHDAEVRKPLEGIIENLHKILGQKRSRIKEIEAVAIASQATLAALPKSLGINESDLKELRRHDDELMAEVVRLLASIFLSNGRSLLGGSPPPMWTPRMIAEVAARNIEQSKQQGGK